MSSEPLSREAFIRQGMASWLSAWFPESLDAVAQALDHKKIRPPGALPQSAFEATCEPFCDACRQACPKEAILTDIRGLPYLDLEGHSPCVMCDDVPCTKVCPTEALTPMSKPEEIRLGTVWIELTACTAYQGSGCQLCYEACPLPNDAILLNENLPHIQTDRCTGCGVCLWACPTPEALSFQPISEWMPA